MKVVWDYYLLLVNPYKFMSGCFYFRNNLRHKQPRNGLYTILPNLFLMEIKRFQRNHGLIATPSILQYCFIETVFISEKSTQCRFGALLEIRQKFS